MNDKSIMIRFIILTIQTMTKEVMTMRMMRMSFRGPGQGSQSPGQVLLVDYDDKDDDDAVDDDDEESVEKPGQGSQ